MIDLRKASLLEAVFALPYRFLMPDVLFEDEWLDLSARVKKALNAKGLEVCELPGTAVSRAALYFNQDRRLQLNDCYALALAEAIDESILLTGDASLRTVAESNGIEVHGVLWVIDELASRQVVSPRRLYEALSLFRDDDLVFLPDAEVRRRMSRLRGQL